MPKNLQSYRYKSHKREGESPWTLLWKKVYESHCLQELYLLVLLFRKKTGNKCTSNRLILALGHGASARRSGKYKIFSHKYSSFVTNKSFHNIFSILGYSGIIHTNFIKSNCLILESTNITLIHKTTLVENLYAKEIASTFMQKCVMLQCLSNYLLLKTLNLVSKKCTRYNMNHECRKFTAQHLNLLKPVPEFITIGIILVNKATLFQNIYRSIIRNPYDRVRKPLGLYENKHTYLQISNLSTKKETVNILLIILNCYCS